MNISRISRNNARHSSRFSPPSSSDEDDDFEGSGGFKQEDDDFKRVEDDFKPDVEDEPEEFSLDMDVDVSKQTVFGNLQQNDDEEIFCEESGNVVRKEGSFEQSDGSDDEVEHELTTINMETIINQPLRIAIWAEHNRQEEMKRCPALNLNLLNIDEKYDCNVYIPKILRPKAEPQEILCRERREIGLLFDVYDEETRIDERHPLASLQVALLREWCMLNLLDARDVDRIFTS